jgi:GntR family transcriptional regulator / MocR family aminotransferase
MSTSISTSHSRALYDGIKAAIKSGALAPGSRMLSTRACAAERGLSRTTVTAVYEQLAAEGYIDTSPGRVSRVSSWPRPHTTQPTLEKQNRRKVAPREHKRTGALRISDMGVRVLELMHVPIQASPNYQHNFIDFAYGPISGRDFPTLAWRKATRTVELQRPERLEYADSKGEHSFRIAIQRYLARARGLECALEQIIVVSGSQQAIDLCARLFLNANDSVVVENPGYKLAHQVFEAHGALLKGVAVDSHGLITSELSSLRSVRLVYVTPTHQYPLGGLLTMSRRQELLHWAQERDAWVIEDDYDSEYRYAVRLEPALQSVDPFARVIYIGTFSKTLSPQLRLGYMVVPLDLVDLFASAKRLFDRHTATAAQKTLALMLENGVYERHVRRMRRLQNVRCTTLIEALERHFGKRITIQGAGGGLHLVLWVHALRPDSEENLIKQAQREGVTVYPLSGTYLNPKDSCEAMQCAGLILGYASLNNSQIELGVARLHRAVTAATRVQRTAKGSAGKCQNS